jgi:cholesterol transport system auxiliary component
VKPVPILALLALAVSLAGCVSVLPKSKPAQLYRFGAPEAAGAAGPVSGPLIGHGAINFEAGAATDRILTVTGNDAAYIEGARWIAPAQTLFDEALIRAFQAAGTPQLADRVASGRAPLSLNLDVQAFEARYDQGPEAAPQVLIQVRASLVRSNDRSVAAQTLITSAQRAGDNRVGPIVAAYDAGVKDVMAKLVAWTAQTAR